MFFYHINKIINLDEVKLYFYPIGYCLFFGYFPILVINTKYVK